MIDWDILENKRELMCKRKNVKGGNGGRYTQTWQRWANH